MDITNSSGQKVVVPAKILFVKRAAWFSLITPIVTFVVMYGGLFLASRLMDGQALDGADVWILRFGLFLFCTSLISGLIGFLNFIDGKLPLTMIGIMGILASAAAMAADRFLMMLTHVGQGC